MIEVVFYENVLKYLKKLEKQTQIQILQTIRNFCLDPGSADLKKLKGRKNEWRIRSGDYRILFEWQNSKMRILVIKIGHRKEIYE